MTNIDNGGTGKSSPQFRKWLVETYRANMDVIEIELTHGPMTIPVDPGTEGARPVCRCYRCGALLTVDTVRVSGGPLNRSIRPACGPCDDLIGGV